MPNIIIILLCVFFSLVLTVLNQVYHTLHFRFISTFLQRTPTQAQFKRQFTTVLIANLVLVSQSLPLVHNMCCQREQMAVFLHPLCHR